MLKTITLSWLILGFCFPAYNQTLSPEEVKSRVDAVISGAYREAATQFPCKVKSSGDPKMLRWHDVGKCLNNAYDRVDWGDVSQQLGVIRKDSRLQAGELQAVADSSLAAHALTYDKVFIVKDKETMLPLSNSLLKFLPEGSLQDLPVFDKKGQQVGTFSGTYSFEKSGSISGGINRLVLFQYTDIKGNVHPAPEKLLMDSHGVPWKGAIEQPGFRLPADKILIR